MLDFIFYRSYLFFEKQKYRKKPASKASGVVGGLILLNIYAILSIVKTYLFSYTVNPLFFVLIAILTIVFASVVFNSRRIYKLIERYSKCSKKQLIIKRIIGNAYIVLSIILFFKCMVNLTV